MLLYRTVDAGVLAEYQRHRRQAEGLLTGIESALTALVRSLLIRDRGHGSGDVGEADDVQKR